MAYQVVEKTDFGTDWAPVRYNEKALTRFDSEDDAFKAATDYLTEVNCNNTLTKDEKRHNIEAFMMTENGAFLGILDGHEWFLQYPKDITDRQNVESDGSLKTLYRKGENVKDPKWFELEGKTQVSVRILPGT